MRAIGAGAREGAPSRDGVQTAHRGHGGHIAEWNGWMRAVGGFYDYRDTDGFGRVYEVHRRSIMPAIRVCRE